MRRFQPDAWLVYSPSVTSPDLFGWWQRPARYVLFAGYHGRPERVRRRIWRPLFAASHRRSVLAADAITVYRPQSVARMVSEGVASERIFLLPPAVNVPDILTPKQEARRKLGLAADAAVVLCVARFTGPARLGRPGKTASILELLRVVKTLSESVVCVLVGDGPGRTAIEEERARLGLGSRVLITGHVPNRDIPVYHAASDVFAYPYDLDRPSMAVMEAQANGRPAVRMRSPSAELAVEEGRTGLLADDIDEFRTHLEQLLTDRARCEAMGEAAREYIARAHSVDVRVRQIITLLSQPGGALSSSVLE
jgi:glycosyltransferase involved in cell wall biosynthesis